MDFSQLLIEKIDTITNNWVEAVRADSQIESADDLPHTAIEDHLPFLLRAIATVLDSEQESDIQTIVQNSWTHGTVRADQGYTPTEVAREYHLLRSVLFSTLEADLLKGTLPEVMRVYNLVDATIDEAITQSFEAYMDERLLELQQLRTTAELTNQELTRLVKAHQDNLSQLAHELKNPLNSIIGYSDLYLRSSRKQQTESRGSFADLEQIERVLRNGRLLLRLVNDALEVSRCEVGEMQLHPVPTDVRAVIEAMMEVLKPIAGAKELQQVVDCSRAPEIVLTDSFRLQQIVTNLVSNAIRYTESGLIKVTCQQLADNQWSVAVSDTGIGIAPEDQDRIFEPYFRVGASGTYLPDSTGLGLAIVKRLVKLLQGKIELVSSVGVGSTFTVILPLEVQTVE